MEEVDFCFVKSGKSSGLLVTHNSYIFYKDGESKKKDKSDGYRVFHSCSFRKSAGCKAAAVTRVN